MTKEDGARTAKTKRRRKSSRMRGKENDEKPRYDRGRKHGASPEI